jgi:hypothetical protein
MEHDWMVREIEGLRDYARLNGLTALAEALDQARLLAQVEIATRLAHSAPPAGAR